MQGLFLIKRGFLVVVVAFSALVLAVGCGSSDSPTTASSETSTGSQGSSSGEPPGGSSNNQSGESSDGSSGGLAEGGSNEGKSSEGGSSGGSGEGKPGGGNGGGNGNGAAAGKAGTPASDPFTKSVLTVCAKHKQRWEEEARVFLEKTKKSPPKPSETPPEIVLIETIFVPTFQAEVDDLRALDAPSSESWFGEFVDALQTVVDETDADPESFLNSEGSFGEAEKLGRAHGVFACADV
jgi:hypothetical protein